MTAKALNSTAIKVTWQPMNKNHMEILGYKLFYQKSGESRKTIIHTSDVTAHIFTRLGKYRIVSAKSTSNKHKSTLISA